MKFFEADGRPFEALLKPLDARVKLLERFPKEHPKRDDRQAEAVQGEHRARKINTDLGM
jgi:hypothetical protein